MVIAVAGQAQAPLAAALGAAGVRFALYLIVLALLGGIRQMQLAREKEARTDYLTGAANARAFEEAATAEIERGRRYGQALSLLYLDVDDFKASQRHLRPPRGGLGARGAQPRDALRRAHQRPRGAPRR